MMARTTTSTRRFWNLSVCSALGFLLLTGCDKPDGNASAAATTSATATATASAEAEKPKPKPKPKASAKPRPMPPRPVPLGSSGPVQATDTMQKQMMAINYTIAMLSAQPGDPSPDHEAISAVTAKLSQGKLTARSDKGGRLIVIDTPTCGADTPQKTLVGRGGTTLKQAHAMGVNVIKCHSRQWACHQSTRNPKDVLCHAAPKRSRRKRVR